MIQLVPLDQVLEAIGDGRIVVETWKVAAFALLNIAVVFASTWFASYFSQSGKNQATKKDISAITHSIEPPGVRIVAASPRSTRRLFQSERGAARSLPQAG